MTSARFRNVEHRAPDRAAAAKQARLARKALAVVHVRTALAAMLDGASGEFRTDVVEALLGQSVDVAAAHHDGAFACSMLGFHAGRAIGRVSPRPNAALLAQVFGGEGGE